MRSCETHSTNNYYCEVTESLKALLNKELQYQWESNSLETWREPMIEWMYKVIDHFDFDRQIVAVSTSLFDRYISKLSSVEKSQIKLISLTSLYIAVKLNVPRNLKTMEAFVSLGQGQFNQNDIESMERKILFTLQWLVNPPTSQIFLKYYLDIIDHSLISESQMDVLKAKATYIIECMVFRGQLSNETYSSIAMASLVLAMSDIDETLFSVQDQKKCLSVLECITHIQLKNIKALVRNFQLVLEKDGLNLHQISLEVDPDCLLFEGFNTPTTTQESRISYTIVPHTITPTQSPI